MAERGAPRWHAVASNNASYKGAESQVPPNAEDGTPIGNKNAPHLTARRCRVGQELQALLAKNEIK